MKLLLLPVLLCAAVLLTGCETVAVVDRSPVYGRTVVHYDSGRPYYYNSGIRYWGYPRGYSGSRSYTRVDVDRDVTRNYYVDRRTVRRGDRRPQARPYGNVPTKVKAQQQRQNVKKKGNRNRDRDRDRRD